MFTRCVRFCLALAIIIFAMAPSVSHARKKKRKRPRVLPYQLVVVKSDTVELGEIEPHSVLEGYVTRVVDSIDRASRRLRDAALPRFKSVGPVLYFSHEAADRGPTWFPCAPTKETSCFGHHAAQIHSSNKRRAPYVIFLSIYYISETDVAHVAEFTVYRRGKLVFSCSLQGSFGDEMFRKGGPFFQAAGLWFIKNFRVDYFARKRKRKKKSVTPDAARAALQLPSPQVFFLSTDDGAIEVVRRGRAESVPGPPYDTTLWQPLDLKAQEESDAFRSDDLLVFRHGGDCLEVRHRPEDTERNVSVFVYEVSRVPRSRSCEIVYERAREERRKERARSKEAERLRREVDARTRAAGAETRRKKADAMQRVADAEARTRFLKKWGSVTAWTFIAGGTGLVAGGFAQGRAASDASARSQSLSAPFSEASILYDEAASKRSTSTILYVSGGVALATGIGFKLLGPGGWLREDHSDEASISSPSEGVDLEVAIVPTGDGITSFVSIAF